MAQIQLPIILLLLCSNLLPTRRSLQTVTHYPHFWRGYLSRGKVKIHHWTSSKELHCWKIASFSIHDQARLLKTQDGTQKCKRKQPMGHYWKHWRLHWKDILDHFGIFRITHVWHQQNRLIQSLYSSWYHWGIIIAITFNQTLQENQMQSRNTHWRQNSISLLQIIPVLSAKEYGNESKEPTKIYLEPDMHFPLLFGIKN